MDYSWTVRNTTIELKNAKKGMSLWVCPYGNSESSTLTTDEYNFYKWTKIYPDYEENPKRQKLDADVTSYVSNLYNWRYFTIFITDSTIDIDKSTSSIPANYTSGTEITSPRTGLKLSNTTSTYTNIILFRNTTAYLPTWNNNSNYPFYGLWLGSSSGTTNRYSCNVTDTNTYTVTVLEGHAWYSQTTTVNTYNVTQTLSNCTSDYSENTITDEKENTITLTANDGYEFTETPTSNQGTVTVSEDKKTVTIVVTVNSDLIISANASKIINTYSLTQNLENCTSDYSSTTITNEKEVTITLKSNDGYEFSTTPTTNLGNVTVSEDKKTVIITGTPTENITITATATKIIIKYTFTQNLTNCTSNVAFTEIIEDKQYTVQILPDSGYTLKNADITATYGTVIISDDGTSATITFTANADNTITATSVKIPDVVTITQHLTKVTSDFVGDTVTEGEKLSITYTVIGEHISIDDIPIIDGLLDSSFVINEEKSIVLITGTVGTSAITITVVGTQYYQIVSGIGSNCTFTFTNLTQTVTYNVGDYLAEGTNIEIIATAKEHYCFETTGSYTNGEETGTLKISADTFKVIKDIVMKGEVTATATAVLQKFTITQTLKHCRSDNSSTKADYGEIVEFHLYSVDGMNTYGFIFNDVPTIVCGDTTITMTLNSDKTEATGSIECTDNIKVTGTATASKTTMFYLSGGIGTVTDDSITSYTVTLTAKGNRTWKEPNKVTYYVYNENTDTMVSFNATDSMLNDSSTIITITSTTGIITAVIGTAEEDSIELGKLVNIYDVTPNILSEIAEGRFKYHENTYTSTSANSYDYGTYIYDLYGVDFDYSDNLTVDEYDIKLGSWNTGLKAKKISNYRYDLDLGSIEVLQKYNSFYDYLNTATYIYLPYVGRSSIDVNEVMGKTINITLKCDFYSGEGTYILKDNSDGRVIYTIPVDFSDSIPYMTKGDILSSTTSGQQRIVNGVQSKEDNDIITPYIKIVRNKPIILSSTTSMNDYEKGLINDLISEGIIDFS